MIMQGEYEELQRMIEDWHLMNDQIDECLRNLDPVAPVETADSEVKQLHEQLNKLAPLIMMRHAAELRGLAETSEAYIREKLEEHGMDWSEVDPRACEE